MKKLFVGNLSPETSEADVRELFSHHGKVRSLQLAADLFTRQCKGFGFVEMEGHEARAAIAALDGRMFNGRPLKVNEERADAKRGRGGRR